MTVDVPIIYLVFNRPDLTAITFDAVRRARPRKLFIVADGPRDVAEAVKCAAVRDIVANVDWECEVFRNYSDANLGCRARVSSGITWALERVEEAIILEDDCLPSPSFFRFMADMLGRFRDDRRVMCISGASFLGDAVKPESSYYFSPIAHMWGWATWKRAWDLYDADMESWPRFQRQGGLRTSLPDSDHRWYWTTMFQRMHAGEIDTWDYPWIFTCLLNRGLTVMPYVNLVSNLGVRPDATHTLPSTIDAGNLPTQNLGYPLVHPAMYWHDHQAEEATFNAIYKVRKPRFNLVFRVKSFVKDRVVRPLCAVLTRGTP